MAFDCFLKISGIDGESKDDQHKDEIELISINWGATQSGTSGYGGGAGAGRVSMENVDVVKKFDKASPKLMLACCNGKHIPDAVVTIRKAGEEQQEYMKIKLNDVIVTSVTAGGSGEDEIPIENVSFDYGKIEVEYSEQDEKGQLKGVVKAHWDVKANKGG